MHAVDRAKSEEAAGLAWRAGVLAATLLALGLPFFGAQAVAQTSGRVAAPAREWLTPPPGDV